MLKSAWAPLLLATAFASSPAAAQAQAQATPAPTAQPQSRNEARSEARNEARNEGRNEARNEPRSQAPAEARTDARSEADGATTATTATATAHATAHATANSPRAFTARDLVTLDRVGSPQLSPDGRHVAFTVREVDYPANRATTGLWRVPLAGGDPQRLTAPGTSIASPQWTADGEALLFLSAVSGSMQVWRVPASGGEAVQVTDYPLDVGSFKLAPGGGRIAFSADVFLDCDTLQCTRARLGDDATASGQSDSADADSAANPAQPQRTDGTETAPASAGEGAGATGGSASENASGVLYEQLFVRHWDSWKDGRRSQLFVATLDTDGRASAEPVRISSGVAGDVPSKPFGGADEYAWSPDAATLVFAAREGGSAEAWSTDFDLYRAPADGSAPPVNLTNDNPAWDTAPAFSADGATLYYLAMRRPGFEADRLRILAMDLASGRSREVAPDFDHSAGPLTVGADGTLYTSADRLGQHPLFAIDPASGTTRMLVEQGYVSGFDVGAHGIVANIDTLGAPANLHVLHGNDAPRQLTHFNRERLADVRFGAYEQFQFKGWNDETVHGYLIKPWNYQEGQSYPVAFLIHGGPQGSMANHFHYRWNPQTYAGRGYAAIMIDFHGSTGYGQDFTDSISGDWGGKPLEDLQKGYAAALQKYPFLDRERACALGASYGGYMVNWIAGKWQQPWDCLVNHDGVFDNRMMYYATEELWFTEWEHGGPHYQRPQAFEQFNPINHVADWSVPMLVVQGELDYRIPVTQGLATFTALQRRNIPSQLLYFPDENHWVLKPHNSVQWHDTVEAWLDRWTRGD